MMDYNKNTAEKVRTHTKGSIKITDTPYIYRAYTLREWLGVVSDLRGLKWADLQNCGIDTHNIVPKPKVSEIKHVLELLGVKLATITHDLILTHYYLEIPNYALFDDMDDLEVYTINFKTTDTTSTYSNFTVTCERQLYCLYIHHGDTQYLTTVTTDLNDIINTINQPLFPLHIYQTFQDGTQKIFATTLKKLIRSKHLSKRQVLEGLDLDEEHYLDVLTGTRQLSNEILLQFCIRHKIQLFHQQQLGVYRAEPVTLLHLLTKLDYTKNTSNRVLAETLLDLTSLLLNTDDGLESELTRVAIKYNMTSNQLATLRNTLN